MTTTAIITILIILTLTAMIMMTVRDSMMRRHLQSKHVLKVFASHDNHIQLNKTVSMTLEEYQSDEKKDSHTESFLVSLIMNDSTIDTARIDVVSTALLTNHHSELKFKGPWHQLVVKQYIPFSKQVIQQEKERLNKQSLETKEQFHNIQEQFK